MNRISKSEINNEALFVLRFENLNRSLISTETFTVEKNNDSSVLGFVSEIQNYFLSIFTKYLLKM